jgi:formylglycine-generating enzyme required for sulfatase activity
LIAELDKLNQDNVPAADKAGPVMDAILFHPKLSERRALILALGEYQPGDFTAEHQKSLQEKLLEAYRNDPDAGIHGAAEWTLRRWKQEKKIDVANAELKAFKFQGDRRWFINSEGQTFAVIEPPVDFTMGSPPTEVGREGGNKEMLHHMRINRRVAFATKEVTIEQYRRFQREVFNRQSFPNNPFMPTVEGPQGGVTWYLAAFYCNWLSRREGLAECYEPNRDGVFAEGMKVVPHVLDRLGYRLPTEEEWECVCRAGAETSRYYGRSTELLNEYAWFAENAKERMSACGVLKPNDLGIFDMLGNAFEWCQDGYRTYSANDDQLSKDLYNFANVVTESPPHRVGRGRSFNDIASMCRSAHRLFLPPSDVFDNFGFRVVRTLPRNE